MSKNVSRFRTIRIKWTCLAGAMACLAGTTAGLAQTPASGPTPASEGPGTAPASIQMPPVEGPFGGTGLSGFVPSSQQTSQPEKRATAGSTARVRVDDNNLVDLAVNDEDLGTVLEMLSIQSQRNIIASKNVSARVTANLYRVSFFEALDAILGVNGYGYVDNGNYIMVYTREEIEKMQASLRKRVTRVIPLNYLNATDAAEFVKPLLSVQGPGTEAGVIKANGRLGSFPTPGDTPGGGEDYANGSVLVVFDYEENVAAIEELVKQLDTRPAQVLVEATILQTTLNEANALGVDFSIVGEASLSDFVGFGGPLGAVNGLIRGATTPTGSAPLPVDGGATGITSTVGSTAGAGGFKVGIVSNDVAVFLRVLDEVTDTVILSNPKVLALNRQSSRVLVGRKVGYLSTTSTDTATTQTVQFLDTGTQLYFRPTVANDGMIRMELKPQVSEAVIREQQDATGAAVTIPDEITNEMTTNVIVRDGQTIVLGGLFRESTETGRKQIPLLGDIPIIGYAFRGQTDEVQRNEIIFMITPHIVTDTVLSQQGERGMDQANRVRAGAREGVLFFSRDKLTTLMNVKAEEAAERGDTDRALWWVGRSLAVNHMQPEAIGLREKLAGEKMNWPERSILERVIHGEKATLINRAAAPTSTDVTNLVQAVGETGVTNNSFASNGTGEDASFRQTFNQDRANTPTSTDAGADKGARTPATASEAAARLYDTLPTATSFGQVALFNQFVSVQRNAFLEQKKREQFTNVPDEREVAPVDRSFNR